MRLLIVRHAIAIDRADGSTDDDLRPLTDEGRRKMIRNARGLKVTVGQPSLLVSSPLLRAVQTAEILQSVWPHLKIDQCEALRPSAKPLALASWLNARLEGLDENPLIVMTGHEPHLSQVVSWFLSGATKSIIELKKGGACLLEFPDRVQKDCANLKWLATPKFLRALK